MIEQDYQTMRPEERHTEFLRIFDMTPKDLPGAYYSSGVEEFRKSLADRRNSEMKAILTKKLDNLLVLSNLTDTGKAFFSSTFAMYYVYGSGADSSSKILKAVFSSIETPEGIFGPEAAEIDNAAYWIHYYEILGIEADLGRGEITEEEVGNAIVKGRADQERWRNEHKAKYGKGPSPIVVE